MEQRNKEKLVNELKRYNELYRKGEPAISDQEYDAMVEELRGMDAENEWLNRVEPVAVAEGRKVKLPIPMKSLNKAKSMRDLLLWIKSLSIGRHEELVVTPKFDGVSLLYSCVMDRAFSRGGAENEGQDCTPHFKMLPKCAGGGKVNWECVFGEFVFSREKWETNFAGQRSPETGDMYKSPRNTAAGLLNRDEPSKLIESVDFFRYGIDSYSTRQFDTYKELFRELCRKYRQPELMEVITVGELSEEWLSDVFKKFEAKYYIDGLVLYLNDVRLWETIGRHQSTGNPLYAIAYKSPTFTDSFITKVNDVTWKIAKSGALRPVVRTDSVDTGDCVMDSLTGYNARWIKANQIAKGALIRVTRSGGVIPKILETVREADSESVDRMFEGLKDCPYCGAPTLWDANEVDIVCESPLCSGVRLAKMVFFYLTCGAENVGETTIEKIYMAGHKTISDLLHISLEELLRIDGIGESVANVVLANNRKILDGVDLLVAMHASDCFDGIGQAKAKKVLEDLGERKAEQFFLGEYVPKLSAIKRDKNVSKAMLDFQAGVFDFYQFVRESGIKLLWPNLFDKPVGDKCAGMKVCFSGFRSFELERAIADNGGVVTGSVSKHTTHLVVADIDSSSGKVQRAKELGVSVLTAVEFEAILTSDSNNI